MTLFEHIFSSYWSGPVLYASLRLLIDLLGALALGALVGYERFYHGHAAGMRTYGVVCMASAALVAIIAHPDVWFGGQVAAAVLADPTRVMQGIVTGIGFLGAGVIVHEQYSTHGLTTAASIWASSAIGILVGLELYPAAIGLALLSTACMGWGSTLERRMASQEGIAVLLQFHHDRAPDIAQLHRHASEYGYSLAQRSLAVSRHEDVLEWRFVAILEQGTREEPIVGMTERLSTLPDVTGFQLAHARV